MEVDTCSIASLPSLASVKSSFVVSITSRKGTKSLTHFPLSEYTFSNDICNNFGDFYVPTFCLSFIEWKIKQTPLWRHWSPMVTWHTYTPWSRWLTNLMARVQSFSPGVWRTVNLSSCIRSCQSSLCILPPVPV